MKISAIVFMSILLLSSCNQNNNKNEQSVGNSNSHHVIVKEVLQTSSYSYLYVEENDQGYWMAVNKMEVEVGESLYYEEALEMRDFMSKELDRSFERILFIQNISGTQQNLQPTSHESSSHGKEQTEGLIGDIDPIDGGITIGELYKNRNNYAQIKVVIRGKVVKVNNHIMNRNWVHLQDGTEDSGNFDLLITTQEEVKVGDIVTLEGTVALNQDFGAGYSYDLIIEDAYLK